MFSASKVASKWRPNKFKNGFFSALRSR